MKTRLKGTITRVIGLSRSEGVDITYFRMLSAAGFAATAITYGPGRMGFGLFVPELKGDFDLPASTVGLVSSFGFFGFFLALILAQVMLNRLGPKAPVTSGLLLATVGMAIVALSPNVLLLAVGVFLTSASAGFAWTPFNDAVNRKVDGACRPKALSRISTGTSIGIILAAVAAYAAFSADMSWRIAWFAFAVAAALAAIANLISLRSVEPAQSSAPPKAWRQVLDRRAIPLFAIAFVFGTVSAIYISFAADHIQNSGPLPGLPAGSSPAALFLVYGLFGLAGLATGDIRERIGLVMLLKGLMAIGAVSIALIVLWPNMWVALIPSAGLQGMAVMMKSAVLAFWSERLFPKLPSLSFTAALMAYAAGSIVGPALAGIASDTFGASAMFLGAAFCPALLALFLSDKVVRETPIEDAIPIDVRHRRQAA